MTKVAVTGLSVEASFLLDGTISSRPDLAATSYVLMTTHPRRELTDDTQTLADANVFNALIIQRKGLTSDHIGTGNYTRSFYTASCI